MRPSSSIRTPAQGLPSSRIGTTNACTPSDVAADLELREDDRDLGVLRGVADVVLARLVAGVVITNSWVADVVRRDGAERLDVGAVPGLGHREAAHQLPVTRSAR